MMSLAAEISSALLNSLDYSKSNEDKRAIQTLKDYIRIPSVQPNVNYEPCEKWMRNQAYTLNLPLRIINPSKPNKPVFIITWPGSEPDLPSIMLNSHMDVVPVEESKWTHPPFAAVTENGNIYGRGTQDMKSQGVQYLEAVLRLRTVGFQPRRSVHIVFVPDEETGGYEGMGAFIKTRTFNDMNVGLEIDEGIAWPGEEFIVFYGERSSWKFEFVCSGTPGHAMTLVDKPAAEKLRVILNHLMDFRESEKERAIHAVDQGRVTSANVTMVQGGSSGNTVADSISLTVDVRISPEHDPELFIDMAQQWCREAGDTELLVRTRGEVSGVTNLDDSNAWWKAFVSVMDRLNLKIVPTICPGGTDARFLRKLNISALGVSFINKTPLLIHGNDEYINEHVFLRGITIYEELLRELAMI